MRESTTSGALGEARGLARALLLLGLAVWPRAAAAEEAPLFETVAPGVIGALQPSESWIDDSNAVILVGTSSVAVVDAPSNPQTVRRTIERIESLTELPVRYVINTHWHSDHTQGNQLYRERYGADLTIIGHDSLRADVPVRAGAYIEEQRARLAELIPKAEEQLALGLGLAGQELDAEARAQQRAAIDRAKGQLATYESTEMLPPNLTHSDRLTLQLGNLEVRLLHFRAHTDGDTVVYLPASRVLLTGDLLDVLPFAGHGHLESWIETLEQLEQLDVARIVPGHGPIYEGKDHLRLLRDYFRAIVEGTRAAVERGETVEQAQDSIDLSRFREALAGENATLQRNFDAFAPETIARAHAELSGAAAPTDD